MGGFRLSMRRFFFLLFLVLFDTPSLVTAQSSGGHLLGTVTLDGVPLAFTIVDAFGPGELEVSGETDAQGNFDLNVSAGRWTLFPHSTSSVVLPLISLDIVEGQTIADIAIDVRQATQTISGAVVDLNQAPLIGVYVIAETNLNGVIYRKLAVTDGAGAYSLPVFDGGWSVYISFPAPPFIRFETQTVIVDGADLIANFEPIEPTAYFTGQVLSGGLPVPNVEVVASNASTFSLVAAISDENGRFELGVDSGTWSIEIQALGTNDSFISPTLARSIAQGQVISNLVFTLLVPTHTISGVVRNWDLQPVEHASVSGWMVIEGVTYVSRGLSLSDGTYSLPVVNGSWGLVAATFDVPGFRSSEASVVVDNADRTLDFFQSAISQHPVSLLVNVGAPAVFSVQTNAPGVISAYRWQVATGPNSWSDLTDDDTYTGTGTDTLTIPSAATVLSGKAYRVVVTYNGYDSVSRTATLVVSAFASFDSWRQAFFTTDQLDDPVISGPLATPANDGIGNLLKYAFDLNPFDTVSNPLPVPTLVPGYLILHYEALRSDLSYIVEASADLQTWSTPDVAVYSSGAFRSASYPVTDKPRAFLRLRVAPLVP